jgi:hypothetical protein
VGAQHSRPDLIEAGLNEGAGCWRYGDLAAAMDGAWRERALRTSLTKFERRFSPRVGLSPAVLFDLSALTEALVRLHFVSLGRVDKLPI